MAKRRNKKVTETITEGEQVEQVEQVEQDIQESNVEQTDMGVETSFTEVDEVQDSGNDDKLGEQVQEDVVETTELIEGEGVLETNPETIDELLEVTNEINKEVIDIMDENIKLIDIPINMLPGFEIGSKRDMSDPAEIKSARIELTRLREMAKRR